MNKNQKKLEESLARRYMTLSGIPLIEEVEEIDPKETREDAHAGGDNLVHPIDHTKVTTDASNVQGVEASSATTGEVTVVSEAKIADIIKKVHQRIQKKRI